jgi:ABC-2 type transport system permease protein
MFGALWYLTSRSIYNRTVRQISRVRNPRYAIAIILGITYVWFFFFSRLGADDTGANPFAFITSETGQNLISVGVLLLIAAAWVFGKRVDALAFTPAEVYFLFPAPITRRSLVIFKLFRLQIATLISTLIWVILVRRGSGDLSPLARGLGLWTLFGTLSMHRIGAALVQASILQHGVVGLRRQRVVTTILVLLFALFAWAAYTAWQTVSPGFPAAGGLALINMLSAMLQQPLLHALMSPFRMLASAAFASTHAEWMTALPWALAIATVHFIWVITANTAFEEAAAEASAKLATRIAAIRQRGVRAAPQASARTIRSTSLPLSPVGNPAVAIVWKNALGFLRNIPTTTIFVVIVLAAAFLWFVVASTEPAVAQTVVIAWNAMFIVGSIVLGPRIVRNDLRTDLAQLSLLKTYPLPGHRIVAAEVASATLSLTAFQMIPVIIVYVMLLFQPTTGISLADRTLILLAAPVVLVAVNSVNVGIQNGAAIMFPAWMSIGPARPAGIEALGQNLLLAFASFILLAIALIPAAITGTVVYFLLLAAPWRIRTAVVLLAGVLVLLVEVVGLMHALGRLFQRTEPSAVM